MNLNLDIDCIIDSGSPISILVETCVPEHLMTLYRELKVLEGINKSKLNVKGLFYDNVKVDNNTYNIKFYIVDAGTVISGFIG